MLPKSSKHYIQPTASELDLDIDLVQDVVSYYFILLRKALTNLDHYNIQVENLGTFKIKKNELPKLKHKYENHLNILQPETFNQMATKKDIEAKLEKVLTLQNMINAEHARRKEFKSNKK